MVDMGVFLQLFTMESVWILNVFLIILAILLLDYLQRKLLRKLIVHAEEKTKNVWDDALLRAAKKPITLTLWVAGLAFVGQFVYAAKNPALMSMMNSISHVGVIVALTWFASGFIYLMQNNLIEEQTKKSGDSESRIDKVSIEAIGKLLRLALLITAGVVILETLGFSISGVLAFGGIGGIAIGFAAKDVLSNFFGGLMIYLDRPFAVGDWIRSNDREIEGTVEQIGWRQTRIRSFAKRPVYVPNSVFSNIVVENPSRMSHRRIYETLGVRYDDIAKMATIVAEVKTMLQQHPDIDTSQTLIVNFNAFAASSVDFFIYTFTKTTNWFIYHEVKQDVLLQIAHIVSSQGAEFAFPTSTLHIQPQTPELAGLEDTDPPRFPH